MFVQRHNSFSRDQVFHSNRLRIQFLLLKIIQRVTIDLEAPREWGSTDLLDETGSGMSRPDKIRLISSILADIEFHEVDPTPTV